MDVVGVDRSKWTTNPFGGEIVDGFLYGRGAIDDKGMLAVNLQTMLLMQQRMARPGAMLTRDLVMVATSDEEGGGAYGIDWLAAHHRDLLDAEFALNEGGRIRVRDGHPSYCAVQCAEKVPHVVRMTAHGPAGHASIPLRANAIARLARAVTAITAHSEPVRLTDVTRRFFAGLADALPDARHRRAFADVASDDPARVVSAANALAEVPAFDALLRNGISPTMVQGGIRANVIPSECSVTINVRTLPGEKLESLLRRLREAVADHDVDFEVVSRGEEGPPSPVHSRMFEAIEQTVSSIDPGLRTVPYLSTGATDSAALRRMGVHAYGLLPFPLTQEDEDRMHGHDERVAVASLSFGIRLVYGIVKKMVVPA
jgi:acetylornithine deacetylase/succinyl-diaminopimelate desuccinylase-like protein